MYISLLEQAKVEGLEKMKIAIITMIILSACLLLGCTEILEEVYEDIYGDVYESLVIDCVEPMNTVIRNKALSIVANPPPGIEAESAEWKIWQINYWVANNITYIADPKGEGDFAYAHETLKARAGDCEDFAILLASMYEAIGLDAAVAYIDTDGNGHPTHMACFVFYQGNADSFLDKEETILDIMELSSPTGDIKIRFWNMGGSSSIQSKHDSGIWIIADPPMEAVKGMVGYINTKPYDVIRGVDVGN